VIGGLGIGAASTGNALGKLPGPVTFAFAPYGGELGPQVARARESGHEVLLQVPMEPFDYPRQRSGPADFAHLARRRAERRPPAMADEPLSGLCGDRQHHGRPLHRLEQALAPVLRETAKRGLIYLDDGSSARSLASQIAGANNLAFAKGRPRHRCGARARRR